MDRSITFEHPMYGKAECIECKEECIYQTTQLYPQLLTIKCPKCGIKHNAKYNARDKKFRYD
jgi:hypothetical protein